MRASEVSLYVFIYKGISLGFLLTHQNRLQLPTSNYSVKYTFKSRDITGATTDGMLSP